MSARRDYTHVEFDEWQCPVAGCTSGKGGVPQAGTVPGIKRHVKRAHGKETYDEYQANGKFPPMRTAQGPLAKQPRDELLAAAKTRKIKDAENLSHDQLVSALAG